MPTGHKTSSAVKLTPVTTCENHRHDMDSEIAHTFCYFNALLCASTNLQNSVQVPSPGASIWSHLRHASLPSPQTRIHKNTVASGAIPRQMLHNLATFGPLRTWNRRRSCWNIITPVDESHKQFAKKKQKQNPLCKNRTDLGRLIDSATTV